MKISADKLLLVAGAVWTAAGANILRIGVEAWQFGFSIILIAAAIATYLVFHSRIFTKLVQKHDARIRGYGDQKKSVWLFFDKKSYMIMAFMMTFGIGLRVSGLVPDVFIAFFYTGLGTALLGAGVGFVGHYFLDEVDPTDDDGAYVQA